MLETFSETPFSQDKIDVGKKDTHYSWAYCICGGFSPEKITCKVQSTPISVAGTPHLAFNPPEQQTSNPPPTGNAPFPFTLLLQIPFVLFHYPTFLPAFLSNVV